MTPSPHDIMVARTSSGGWTRAQLEAWGVPWPPPKHWRRDLERQWLKECAARAREREANDDVS